VLEPLEPFMGGSEIIREVWLDRATWNDLPWRFEPGTPPIAQAVGLGAALDYLEALGRETVRRHDAQLVAEALARLEEVEDLEVYGPRNAEIRAGVIAFNFPGVHPHDLSAALDAQGVAVRAGHHCAQPLMRRLGVVGTARASFFVHTGVDDVRALTEALRRAREQLGSGRLRPSTR
jgi:cysteine desulfurase/selenocysteine lyase